MSGRKLVQSLAIILENKNPQPANYLHGILILIILTGQICFATTWKITLESGEKFNGITQIYINETTVYLIPRIMPHNNLPIPVYLGDIKEVKCIRYNRFTTAIILGTTGYFLAQYTFDNDIIDVGNPAVTRDSINWLGSVFGLFIARKTSISKLKLTKLTIDKRAEKLRIMIVGEQFRP